MNRIARIVSSAVSLFVVGFAVGACSSAASSSPEGTGSSRQGLCESHGLYAETNCGPPVHPVVPPKPAPTAPPYCASSATCWVWARTGSGWDPSFPNSGSPSTFQQAMTDANCGPEFYFADDDTGGVPQYASDRFQIGHMAICASVPTGASLMDPLPTDCGCPAIPAGYSVVTWRNAAGDKPRGACSMGNCFGSDQPPPSAGLPGEPLPTQEN